MNSFMVSIFALLGVVTLDAANAATVEFRGGLCLTSVTPACSAVGWGEGCYVTFRYNPRSLGTNGTSTRFSIFVPYFGENYTLASGNLVGGSFKTVQGVAVGTGTHAFTSQMKITSQSLTGNSSSISLAGAIQGFDSIQNCNVSFKASGVSIPPEFNQ